MPASGILRYPYEALTETTDYLQLTIVNYSGANTTGSLIEGANFGVNKSAFDVSNTAASSLKPKQLGTNGVIILPMPSNIEDTNSVSFDGDSLNSIVAGAAQGSYDLMKNITIENFLKTAFTQTQKAIENALNTSQLSSDTARSLILKQLAAQAVNVFGSNVSLNQLLARSEGKIFNPNMELLFNNVTLRTFRFNFKMTPRDEVESMQVKSIIRSLKKNMAAKRVSNLYLETPNVFELEYKKGNKLHPFLHRFKQCALSDMSVNYTGENVYATYSDGTPISIMLSLTFKELVPIYEDDYNDSAFPNSNFNDSSLTYKLDSKRIGNKLGKQADVEGVGY